MRVIRCANYTAVCENGSISAITATNNVTLCAARPYSDNAYSTLFFAEAIGGILQTADHRAAAPASAASARGNSHPESPPNQAAASYPTISGERLGVSPPCPNARNHLNVAESAVPPLVWPVTERQS